MRINAQDLPSASTGYDDSKIHISGIGGVITEFSGIHGETGVSMGGGGALLINNRILIGGYGMGLSSNHYRRDIPGYHGTALRTSLGHGGIWAGYMFMPSRRVHFGITSRFGWGSISHNYKTNSSEALQELTNDGIFVITPEIIGEVSIMPWLRFNLAAGYRYLSGVDIYGKNQYNSPVFTIGLVFGGYDEENDQTSVSN